MREQGGRLVGWALGASIARRVLATVNAELDKMSPDGSELRAAFDEWVRREIARLEEDPARAAELGAAIRRVVAHETVQAWLWDVWARLRLALEADAARPTGRTVATIEGALGNLGAMLEADPAARAAGPRRGAGGGRQPAARRRRCGWRSSSRQVVANWDTDTIVDAAGTARRQGPAVRAGERHAGWVPGRRPALLGAAGDVRARQLLTGTIEKRESGHTRRQTGGSTDGHHLQGNACGGARRGSRR